MTRPTDSIDIERWRPDAASVASDTAMLGDVLHACVSSGASVSFILPFSRDDAAAFWRDQVLPAVNEGDCIVLVARQGKRIVGTAQLDLVTPPNQPHRAEVRKLLVHPDVRRGGVARALMLALEDEARSAGRSLLTLDTITDNPAEWLYASLGYIRVGVIP